MSSECSGQAALCESGRPLAAEPAFCWESFVERHGPELERAARHALRRLGLPAPPEDVEELVQDAWCRLLAGGWRGLSGHAAGERLSCYLRRMARSLAIDRLRRRHAVKRGQGVRPASLEVDDGVLRVADPAPSPLERVLARERRACLSRRLHRALGGRSPERRVRVVELALIEGRPRAEIAAILGGLAQSSVGSILHRACCQLRSAGRELFAGED